MAAVMTAAEEAVAAVVAMATIAAVAAVVAAMAAMVTAVATIAAVAAMMTMATSGKQATVAPVTSNTEAAVATMAGGGFLLTAQQGNADNRDKHRDSKHQSTIHFVSSTKQFLRVSKNRVALCRSRLFSPQRTCDLSFVGELQVLGLKLNQPPRPSAQRFQSLPITSRLPIE